MSLASAASLTHGFCHPLGLDLWWPWKAPVPRRTASCLHRRVTGLADPERFLVTPSVLCTSWPQLAQSYVPLKECAGLCCAAWAWTSGEQRLLPERLQHPKGLMNTAYSETRKALPIALACLEWNQSKPLPTHSLPTRTLLPSSTVKTGGKSIYHWASYG